MRSRLAHATEFSFCAAAGCGDVESSTTESLCDVAAPPCRTTKYAVSQRNLVTIMRPEVRCEKLYTHREKTIL